MNILPILILNIKLAIIIPTPGYDSKLIIIVIIVHNYFYTRDSG